MWLEAQREPHRERFVLPCTVAKFTEEERLTESRLAEYVSSATITY